MDILPKSMFFVAGVGAAVGMAVLLAASPFVDLYEHSQVSNIHISCPVSSRVPCLVDIRRERPPKSGTSDDARAAGLEAPSARESPSQVLVSQDQIESFLSAGVPVVPPVP